MQLRYLVLPIIFIILLPIPAKTEENNKFAVPISTILENDINLNRDIKKAIISIEQGIKDGDQEDTIKSVRELEIIRLNLGTEELPFVAEYLRRKGEVLIAAGTPGFGIRFMEEARFAFPRYYPIYFDLARIYLSKERLDIKQGIANLIDGLRAYSQLRSRKGRLISFTLIILIAIYILSISIYLSMLLLKHFKRLHRDIKKILHLPEEGLLSSLISLFAIFLPLITGGLFPFLISIPIFVWGYLKNIGGRVFLIISVICLILFYPVTQGITWSLIEDEAPFVRELERFSQHIWDAETLAVFKEQLQSQPDDYFLNTSIGLMYKRMNEKEKAIKYFQDQLKRYPDDPYILLNIGDIKLISGKNDEAIKIYNRVINIDPDNVEAHYNLSIALINKFEMDMANEEYKKAYALNSSRVDRYLDSVKKGLNMPMDEIPDMDSYKGKHPTTIYSRSESLYDLFLFPFGLQGWYMAIPCMLLIVAGFWWLITRKGVSDQCYSCGSLLEEGAKCTLCSALRLSPDRLDPKMREEGIRKVNNYRKINKGVSLLSNFLLPGAGMVLTDYNTKGFIVIALNVFFISCTISILYFQFAPILTGLIITLYLFFNSTTNLIFLKTG